MIEILIPTQGNRFLMNKIEFKLLLMKNPTITKEIWIFTLVKSVSGICWCGCYDMIQYSIHNFSAFCKNFNLETGNI